MDESEFNTTPTPASSPTNQNQNYSFESVEPPFEDWLSQVVAEGGTLFPSVGGAHQETETPVQDLSTTEEEDYDSDDASLRNPSDTTVVDTSEEEAASGDEATTGGTPTTTKSDTGGVDPTNWLHFPGCAFPLRTPRFSRTDLADFYEWSVGF